MNKEMKEALKYNSKTGKFTWLKDSGKNRLIGKIAGTNHYAHIGIKFRNKLYRAHRLAWFFHHGEIPNFDIDHINGNPRDNRIENLRKFTHRQNHQNRPEHRKGKLVGVSWHIQHNKYISRIQINGKLKHLGYFDTELEAHNAYLNHLKIIGEPECI